MLRTVPLPESGIGTFTSWSSTCGFSPNIQIGTPGPNRSLYQGHATYMPVTIWTVSGFPPDLSGITRLPHGLDDTKGRYDTFTVVHLYSSPLGTHLTGSLSRPFPVTFTTMALYHSSLQWFEASTCMATSRDPPSSSIKHG